MKTNSFKITGRTRIAACLLACLLLIGLFTNLPASFVQAAGNTYYMATSGNGGSSNNPGTIGAPFSSIADFMAVAKPGDTLYIRGGTYYATENHINKSGSVSGGYITIANYPGEAPVFDGLRDQSSSGTNCIYSDDGSWDGGSGYLQYVIIDGLIIKNYKRSGINMGSNYKNNNQIIDHIIVRNNVVDYCGQNGITVSFGDYCTVENNMVSRTGFDINYGSWSSNINLYNMTGTHNVVHNNVSFHAVDVSDFHTDGNGLILDMYQGPSGAGATVTNNLIFENGGAGIAWTRNDNAYIYNNTLYENGLEPSYNYKGYGLVLWRETSQGNFNNINLANNIIYQSSGKGIYKSAGISSGTITNNNISGESGCSNPLFTNPSSWDFTLQSSSPSLNTGSSSYASADSLGLDKNVIKSQTSNQPISWWHLVPDFDYIISKGGFKNCFHSVSRPQGSGYDLGAFEKEESGGTNPGNGTITNPGFEDNMTGWSTTNAAVSYTETAGPRSGSRNFANWSNAAYEAYTYQTVTGLTNGTYTLNVWGQGDSGTTIVVAKNYGGNELSVALNNGTASYSKYSIANIAVTNNQLEIGIYTNTNASTGKWMRLDDFELVNNSASSNKVANPGFENGTNNWYLDSIFSVSTADKYSGSSSLKMVGTGNWKNAYQPITVSPNTDYTLSFYMKGSASTQAVIFNSDWSTRINSKVFTPTSSWAKYTLTFNSGNRSTIALDLQDASSGTTYIDDIAIQ